MPPPSCLRKYNTERKNENHIRDFASVSHSQCLQRNDCRKPASAEDPVLDVGHLPASGAGTHTLVYLRFQQQKQTADGGQTPQFAQVQGNGQLC